MKIQKERHATIDLTEKEAHIASQKERYCKNIKDEDGKKNKILNSSFSIIIFSLVCFRKKKRRRDECLKH